MEIPLKPLSRFRGPLLLRSLRGGREIRVVRNNRDARLSIGWSIYLSTAKRFSPKTFWYTDAQLLTGLIDDSCRLEPGVKAVTFNCTSYDLI